MDLDDSQAADRMPGMTSAQRSRDICRREQQGAKSRGGCGGLLDDLSAMFQHICAVAYLVKEI